MDELPIDLETKEKENPQMETVDYDYFSPALIDCWPHALSFVTRPQDIEAVMNTSNLFYDIVESRLFTEMILPILLQNDSFLGKEGMLKCRQLDHKVKAVVDYTLLQKPQRWLQSHVESSEEINWLLEDTKELLPNFNPFMLRATEIYSDTVDDIRSAINLFREFGQYLDQITFFLPSEYEAGPLMTLLIEALQFLPQLRALHLIFSGQREDFQDTSMMEPVAPSNMPKLDKLSELQMLTFAGEHEGEVPPPATFIKSFLQAYGKHVTKFSSNNFIFDLDLGVEFFNNNLPNVEHYKVYDFDEITDAEDGILTQVMWPKLDSLDIFTPSISVDRDALQVLTNFRSSLREIRFPNLLCDDVNLILEAESGEDLPNVKRVILCPSNVNLPIVVEGFPKLLPNLEYIKFLPDYLHLNQPTPGRSIRNGFFERHPKLETFVWSRCSSYSQWMDNEYGRNDVIPSARVCFTKKCS
ncbi:unnamed protein product [Orchesella dallaii]|uniref:Uncharacterized protein n=1 Tax=Orchesella dallaii TaxID=48710 RepID=A0ABP1PLC0_9HEXA